MSGSGKLVRIFLSHASEDKPFVERLCEHLIAGGVTCWFDNREIRLGDSVAEKINEGLAAADYGVLVLSEHYVRKYWTTEELWSLLNKESISDRRLLLPIRLGLDHRTLTEKLSLIAHRLSIDFLNRPKEAADEILRSVLNNSTPAVRASLGSKLSEIGLPEKHTVQDGRASDLDLMGREIFLQSAIQFLSVSADKDFSETGVLAITGLPAAGKSSVARELCYRIGRQFPGGVYWFDASSRSFFSNSVKSAIRILRLTSEENSTAAEEIGILRQCFEIEPCLLIIDSFDTEECHESVCGVLPLTGHSRVIITTRTDRLDLPFRVLSTPLPELDDDSVVALLLQFDSDINESAKRQSAIKVADILGRLPLGLQIAARSMRSNSISISEYLYTLKKASHSWIGLEPKARHFASIRHLLKNAFDHLKSFGDIGILACKILTRCAVINSVNEKSSRWEVVLGKFGLGVGHSVGLDSQDEATVGTFGEAIELAERLGLLRIRDDEGGDLWIHALTLRMLLNRVGAEDFDYLAYRLEMTTDIYFYFFENRGWFSFDDTISGYASILPLVEKHSTHAALKIIDSLFELEPFGLAGQPKTWCEELAKKAILLLENFPHSERRAKALMHFKVCKAQSAFLHSRFDSAKLQFSDLWQDLKNNPIEVEVIDLLDLWFHFGCLLHKIGKPEDTELEQAVFRSAILTLSATIKNHVGGEDLPMPIRLRLSRLLETINSWFPQLSGELESERLHMLASLKNEIDNPKGLAQLSKQFHRARGPMIPFLPLQLSFEDRADK